MEHSTKTFWKTYFNVYMYTYVQQMMYITSILLHIGRRLLINRYAISNFI